MARYQSGRRLIARFTVDLNDRTKVEVVAYERWLDIDATTTARCGDPGHCVVEKTEGVSETHSKTLETSVKSSIGVEGLASLKSQIGANVGHEVNWNESTTTTKTFQFTSPECGSRTLTIYRLVREYELTIWRRSWWSMDRWTSQPTRTIPEHTNTHDTSYDTIDYDESCNCDTPRDPPPDVSLCFDMGRASLRTPGRSHIDGYETLLPSGLLYMRGRIPVLESREQRDGRLVELPLESIPEPLVWAARLQGPSVQAQVFQFVDLGSQVSREEWLGESGAGPVGSPIG